MTKMTDTAAAAAIGAATRELRLPVVRTDAAQSVTRVLLDSPPDEAQAQRNITVAQTDGDEMVARRVVRGVLLYAVVMAGLLPGTAEAHGYTASMSMNVEIHFYNLIGTCDFAAEHGNYGSSTYSQMHIHPNCRTAATFVEGCYGYSCSTGPTETTAEPYVTVQSTLGGRSLLNSHYVLHDNNGVAGYVHRNRA